jgi:putative PEP-CTERM system TPR-repeat lipoprotein
MARGDWVAARLNFESAVQKKSDFVPAMLNLAKLDVAEGKLDDAVKHYTAILDRDSKNVDVMIALAELSLRRQQPPAEAESWLNKAIAVDPNAVVPRVALINFHLSQKDYGKALAAARELRQVAPSNTDAIDAMGRVQMASGDASNAVETYRQLVSAAPTVPLAYQRLAQAFVAAGDTQSAKTALRNGMATNPDAPSIIADLVNLLQRTGEADEALNTAKEWQRRHPETSIGDMIVGGVLMQQGKFSDASASFASAQKKNPSGQTLIALARARVSAGNGDVAVQELQSWIKENPRDVATRDFLATTLISQKKYDLAASESEELLKLQPNNPIVLNNLAWLYSQRNDARAVEFAEKAHSLAPNAAAIKDTLGYILIKSGNTDRGLPMLKEAYDASQKNPEIGYHLAAGLVKTGQKAEAKTLLETVLADQRNFDEKPEAKQLLDSLGR